MDPERVYDLIPKTHSVFLPSLYDTFLLELGIHPNSGLLNGTRQTFNKTVRNLELEEKIRVSIGFYDRRTTPSDNELFLTNRLPREMRGFWPLYRTVERTKRLEERNNRTLGVLAYAGEPTNT